MTKKIQKMKSALVECRKSNSKLDKMLYDLKYQWLSTDIQDACRYVMPGYIVQILKDDFILEDDYMVKRYKSGKCETERTCKFYMNSATALVILLCAKSSDGLRIEKLDDGLKRLLDEVG